MFLSRQKRQTLAGSTLQTNATGSRQQTGTLTGEGARLLRQNRTPAYMDALGKLDAGDARLDPEFAARVVARIRRDLPRDAAWHSTGAMPSWRCTRTAAGGLSRRPCGRDP